MAFGTGTAGRGSRAARVALQGLFLALLLAGGTGCGALSALTNPKAGWAFNEPAPMSVVVRRADTARATADQVERLMGDTKVDPSSAWVTKTSLKKSDAEATLKGISAEPVYAGASQAGEKLRVMPAEAWARSLASICGDGKLPSVIAALGPEVASAYGEIAEQQKALDELKAQKAAEEKALDEKGISASDKETHGKKKDELSGQIDKAEAAFAPKREAFLGKLRSEAGKAPDDVKARLSVVIVNLKRAVEDAKMANSVALIRYPMAVPSLTKDLPETTKRIVADIVEEKTGSRPDLNGFKPDVSLDGTDVKLTLNGVPVDKLGGLSPADMLSETTKRLTAYAKKVGTLAAFAAETQDKLGFEADLLDAAAQGLKVEPSKVKDAGEDFSELKVETGDKTRKPGPKPVVAACASPKGAAEPDKADKTAQKADKADKGAKKAADKSAAKSDKTAATRPATYTQDVAQKPASKPAATKPAKACDVEVMNGDTKMCL